MEGTERDGDKLLPGEAEAARGAGATEARLWLDVYTELCGFKETILNDVAAQRGRVTPKGRTEVDHDEAMLHAEYDRLRRRRDYWTSQLKQRKSN